MTKVVDNSPDRRENQGVFSFPNPVNEYSARIVAGGVVLLALATLITQQFWLLIPIAYGFIARVASGPRFSPLGLLSTRVLTPLLNREPKLVAGPPKRFAQGMGATISTATAIIALVFHEYTAANVLLGLLVTAATLESVFAICIGCHIFARLMKAGLIPQNVCEECADIWSRKVAISD